MVNAPSYAARRQISDGQVQQHETHIGPATAEWCRSNSRVFDCRVDSKAQHGWFAYVVVARCASPLTGIEWQIRREVGGCCGLESANGWQYVNAAVRRGLLARSPERRCFVVEERGESGIFNLTQAFAAQPRPSLATRAWQIVKHTNAPPSTQPTWPLKVLLLHSVCDLIVLVILEQLVYMAAAVARPLSMAASRSTTRASPPASLDLSDLPGLTQPSEPSNTLLITVR